MTTVFLISVFLIAIGLPFSLRSTRASKFSGIGVVGLGIAGLVLAAVFSQKDGARSAEPSFSQLTADYSKTARLLYGKTLRSAQELNSEIETFIESPTQEKLDALKTSWIATRELYSQTEVFRFYDGPIEAVEGFINAWPMDEAWLDYVKNQDQIRFVGIINDKEHYPVISAEVLMEANEKEGEENISTGFHAIEFLLWGQDHSLESAGSRPLSDFVSANNAERRRLALKTLSGLLVQHLKQVYSAWEGQYGQQFVREENVSASMTRIFNGLYWLVTDEIAHERMYVAYTSTSQEDEQSCFSDNTHRDLIQNLQGAMNILFGYQNSVNAARATGVVDVIKTKDSELAKKLSDSAKTAMRSLKELFYSTDGTAIAFDRILASTKNSPKRKQLMKSIESLEQLGNLIKESAELVGAPIAANEEG